MLHTIATLTTVERIEFIESRVNRCELLDLEIAAKNAGLFGVQFDIRQVRES